MFKAVSGSGCAAQPLARCQASRKKLSLDGTFGEENGGVKSRNLDLRRYFTHHEAPTGCLDFFEKSAGGCRRSFEI